MTDVSPEVYQIQEKSESKGKQHLNLVDKAHKIKDLLYTEEQQQVIGQEIEILDLSTKLAKNREEYQQLLARHDELLALRAKRTFTRE